MYRFEVYPQFTYEVHIYSYRFALITKLPFEAIDICYMLEVFPTLRYEATGYSYQSVVISMLFFVAHGIRCNGWFRYLGGFCGCL